MVYHLDGSPAVKGMEDFLDTWKDPEDRCF